MPARSEYFDSQYRRFAALDVYDSQLLADADAAALGSNGFLDEGELALYERRLRSAMPPGPLVDLGCGRGALGRCLARRLGVGSWGIDASAVAIEQAREAFGDHDTHFEVASFCDLPLPDRAAAGMISLDGLYLCAPTDRPRAAAELARVARPGAPLLMTLSLPRGTEPEGSAWPRRLREQGFEVVEIHDLTEPWHRWLRRKHERRLAEGEALEQRLGAAAARDARAVSRAMLDGEPPRYATQRRFRLEARYPP